MRPTTWESIGEVRGEGADGVYSHLIPDSGMIPSAPDSLR